MLIELLKQPSERDKQSKAGPSSLGSCCDRCVQRALRNEPQPLTQYWLGAAIGTAVHAMAEKNGIRRGDPNALLEVKVEVGDVPGYGIIKGSVDRFEIDTGTVRDYKGTTRKDKPSLLAAYDHMTPQEKEPNTHKKARLKLRNYVGQMSLYGLALSRMGYEVSSLVLEFFCRDGSGDDDIFELEFDYDPAFAQAVWDRVVYIWTHMDEDYKAQPHCWPCENGG